MSYFLITLYLFFTIPLASYSPLVSSSCAFFRQTSVSLVSYFLPIILSHLYFPYSTLISLSSSNSSSCPFIAHRPSVLFLISFLLSFHTFISLPPYVFNHLYLVLSSLCHSLTLPHAHSSPACHTPSPSVFRIFRGRHSLSSRTSLPLTHTDSRWRSCVSTARIAHGSVCRISCANFLVSQMVRTQGEVSR